MNTPSQRRVRQVVQKQGQVMEQVIPALNSVLNSTKAHGQRVAALEALSQRPLLGRFKWLLTGK